MKKLVKTAALTLVLCIILSSTAFAAETSARVYGDADGDGQVTYADAQLVFFASLGFKAIDDNQKMLCDVNLNGKLDIMDSVAITTKLIFGLNRFGFETKAFPDGEKIATPAGNTVLESFMKSINVYDFRMLFTIIEFSKLSTDTARGIDRGTMEINVKDYCMSINLKLLTDRLHYIINESNSYLVSPTLRMYSKTDGVHIDMNDYPVFKVPEDLKDELISVSKLTLCGIDYICEEYKGEESGTLRYFFADGVLARIEAYDENGKIESIMLLTEYGYANLESFSIPKGYIEVNLEKLVNLLSL